MSDVASIIDAFGGATSFSREVKVDPPLKVSTVSEMKRRKAIPPKYWEQIVIDAKRCGISGINYATLVRAHAQREIA